MWEVIARWGQVEWVAPAVVAMAIGYVLVDRDRLATTLVAGFVVAALATACTKVAFMAWGVGSQTLDFTGISGHAMCAATIFPLIGASLSWRAEHRATPAIAAGVALAIAIGLSRLQTQDHSASEVLAGLALGAAVAWAAWKRGGPAPRFLSPVLVAVAMLLVAASPAGAEPLPRAHSVLSRIALAISGRAAVYTRTDLHRMRAPQATADAEAWE